MTSKPNQPPPKNFPFKNLNKSAVAVAQDLIGCRLVRRCQGRIIRVIITETEAYEGLDDLASHASRGKTARNEIMFRSAGHIYVYFTYGMHWLLNVVTGPRNHPSAVLIRGAIMPNGQAMNGPARLTKTLNVTGALNGKTLSRKTGLWLETRPAGLKVVKIRRSPRIGVDYAGPVWAAKKWRFRC